MFLRRGVSKRKQIRDILILLAGLLVIGLGALNLLAPVIDISPYQQDIVQRLSQTLQRKFHLDGRLYVKLSLKPTILIQNLTIDNTGWGKAPHMLQAAEVEFSIDVVDWLFGRITIDRLILKQAAIHLEQSASGQNNWTFGAEKPAGETGKKAGPVRLDYALLDDVVLDFEAPQQKQKKFTIAHAQLRKSLRGRYRLELDSKLGRQKFSLIAQSSRWFDLADIRPLEIKLETSLGDNNLSAEMEIQQFIPYLQARARLTSNKLDINNILAQLPAREKQPTKPGDSSAWAVWLEKIGTLTLQVDIEGLRYGRYDIGTLSLDNRFIYNSLQKEGRFSIKSAGQAERISLINTSGQTTSVLSQSKQLGKASLTLEGQGNTVEQLFSNSRFKLQATQLSLALAQPFHFKQLNMETVAEQRLQFAGDISYRDTPINFSGQSGVNFIAQLRQKGHVDVDASLATGQAGAKLNLTVRQIGQPIRKVHLQLSGDHLAEWSNLYGKRLPLIAQYKLQSRFDLRPDGIKSRLFEFETPLSKLKGRYFYHYGKPATLNVLLQNSRLTMSDLDRTPKQAVETKPPVRKYVSDSLSDEEGEPKSKTKAQNTVMVIPSTDLMSLLAPTTDVNLEVKSSVVVFNRFTVRALDLKARWQDKVLAVQVSKGKIAEGDMNADIYLTVVDEEAAGKIEMHVEQLDYGKFMQELKIGDKMKGKADVNIHLVGFGTDLKAFLTNSDGIVEFIGEQGILASKYLKLWGEDIAQYILPFNWFESEETKLNCVVGRFDLTNGRLSSDSLLLDTEGMTIAGTGAINLKTEEMAFELMPDPKNITLISLATPVKIRGTMAKPRIEPHTLGTTWTIGSLLVGLANPAVLIARFAKLGSLGENPCLAAIGKKEGEEQETSVLKMFKDAVKFIQRPLDKMPDLE